MDLGTESSLFSQFSIPDYFEFEYTSQVSQVGPFLGKRKRIIGVQLLSPSHLTKPTGNGINLQNQHATVVYLIILLQGRASTSSTPINRLHVKL